MTSDDYAAIADALELFAGVDDGEYTDTDDLLRLANAARFESQQPPAPRLDEHTYGRIADYYGPTFGEHLVADREWVAPLYETVCVAVDADPSLDRGAYAGEYERRTAEVIAVITHGLERAAS